MKEIMFMLIKKQSVKTLLFVFSMVLAGFALASISAADVSADHPGVGLSVESGQIRITLSGGDFSPSEISIDIEREEEIQGVNNRWSTSDNSILYEASKNRWVTNWEGNGKVAWYRDSTGGCDETDSRNRFIVVVQQNGRLIGETIHQADCGGDDDHEDVVVTVTDAEEAAEKGGIIGQLEFWDQDQEEFVPFGSSTLISLGLQTIPTGCAGSLTGPIDSSIDCDDPSTWGASGNYVLENETGYVNSEGNLRIPDLDPGTYSLTAVYNHSQLATRGGGGQYQITKDGIVVQSGEETDIGTERNQQDRTDYGLPAVTEETADADPPECQAGEGFGWLICGVINLAIDFVKWVLDNVIVPFLEVSPLKAQEGDPVFAVWKNVRTLANLLLAPIFLFFIFAQMTSLNIDAYTIKKTLPRLLIAAIGIQVSFYVVMYMVDITAILGNGIGDLLQYPVQDYLSRLEGEGTINLEGDVGSYTLGGGLVLGTLLASLGGLGGALTSAALAALLGLVPAIIMVFLTLMFRQVAVLLLAIVAPIAFAAWVLPNTQGIFEKWWGVFFKVLMMFPIIVAIFAIADLVAVVASRIEGSGGSALANTAEATLGDVVAVAAYIVPFALIPFTFKFAGSAIAGAANALQSLGGRMVTGRDGKSGILGKMQEKAARDKMEAQAGKLHAGSDPLSNARNTLARWGTNPLSGGSRVPGWRNSRFRNSALGKINALQSNFSEAGKDLEDLGVTDRGVLQDFVRYGQNKGRLNERINDLRHGNAERGVEQDQARAQELSKFLQSGFANSAQHQVAALSRLSDMGLAETEDFGYVNRSLQGLPGTQQQAINDSLFKMYQKGHKHMRPDAVSGFRNNAPQFNEGRLQAIMGGMKSTDLAETRGESYRVFGGYRYDPDTGELEQGPPSGHNLVRDYLADEDNLNQMARAWHSLPAGSREAIEEIVPEYIEEIRNRATPQMPSS